MSISKKNQPSIIGDWSTMMNQIDHIATEDGDKAVYRVEPVDLDTFVTSPEYLNQGLWGMSESQKEYILAGSDFDNDITFMVIMVGKGGGKNWATGIMFLYTIYKLLCMYDPHKYLDHNPARALTFINMAINHDQALKNFFNPLAEIVKTSGEKAFKQFGFNPDTDIQAKQIIFPKNIEVISSHSKAGGAEGYDIFRGVADEVDDSEFIGVDKAITTLRSSGQSRFEGKETIVVISYQRYVGSSGKITELYTSATGHDHIFARRYASWDFHPVRSRESFQTYFDENPEEAACIYGSEISGSFMDSWIKDPLRIKNAMNWERKWILDWPIPYDPDVVGSESWVAKVAHREWRNLPTSEYEYRVDRGSKVVTLDPYDIPIRIPGDPNKIYVLCGDPALGSAQNGGDGYGLAMGHREIVEIDGVKYPRVVVDFAFRFTGRMFEEGQVQMKAIELLIRKLKERYGYNIKYFSWDGWNSMALTQWIAKTYPGVVIRDRNIVDTDDYSALRDALFAEAPPSNGSGEREVNGGIDLPWHPIVYEEFRGLTEDRSKKKARVDHTSSGSKDIADTIAKLTYVINYQWPFAEASLHTASANPVLDSRPLVDDHLRSRISSNIATDEERRVYYETLASDTVGLGGYLRKGT